MTGVQTCALPISDTTKLPERDLAIISIALDGVNNVDTNFHYGMTNTFDKDKVWEMVPEIPDSLRVKASIMADSTLLSKLIRATRIVNPKTVFAVDADRNVSFKHVFLAMNIMRLNKATAFNYVTEKKKEEETQKKE